MVWSGDSGVGPPDLLFLSRLPLDTLSNIYSTMVLSKIATFLMGVLVLVAMMGRMGEAASTLTKLRAAVAVQSTPDGETPANEGVCDTLWAPGVTKGLYGICVAFCEAQDCDIGADGVIPESCRPSSQRLLDVYNKRKSDTDPEIPCRPSAPNCPCWTDDELASNLNDVAFTICIPPAFNFAGGYSENTAGVQNYGGSTVCTFADPVANLNRFQTVSAEEFEVCNQSLNNLLESTPFGRCE